MELKQKEYKRKREVLNQYFAIHSHSISNDLQGQLHNYLKYSVEGHKEKQANLEFVHLISKFPQALQHQVKRERYRQHIGRFTTLKDQFPAKTLEKLVHIVQEEYYMPNQIIFSKDLPLSPAEQPKLYLILSGQV